MENNSPSTTSLADQLEALKAGITKAVPLEVSMVLDDELRKLVESSIAQRAIQIGQKAPDFSLPDTHGMMVNLMAFLSKGPVVLTFYRGGWCPFCDLQLRTYEDVLPEIHALGAEILAVSPQTRDYAALDVEKKHLTFPVLTDVGNVVASQYGLVFKLSDPLRKLQEGFNNPLPKFNGDDSWELPMPGTFVLDRGGIVRLQQINPNYMKRLEPSAILEALRHLGSGTGG